MSINQLLKELCIFESEKKFAYTKNYRAFRFTTISDEEKQIFISRLLQAISQIFDIYKMN